MEAAAQHDQFRRRDALFELKDTVHSFITSDRIAKQKYSKIIQNRLGQHEFSAGFNVKVNLISCKVLLIKL